MSSCSISVCLLVLLGVVLVSGHPLQFITETMKQARESIATELELTLPEIGSNPLFSSVIDSMNSSCQMKDNIQLMNATLDVYMRIFSSILQHDRHQHHNGKTKGLLDGLSKTKKSHVVSALMKLKNYMETLRSNLSYQNHNKEDVLSRLSQIKVDNLLVQKKALAEFLEVYQTASVIGYQCS